ncbi:hypothetical protein GCM10009654_59220 [Streptomyces hebeiensis]|uniref:DUF397 domain-containing protein n=1 Tax=Streptomyces hebeiensis TaxID=229486 RepID=A0ABP4FPH6_9ACTN
MSDFVFVKSTYSASGGECVEVADNIPGTVAVRDSKRPAGPVLRLAPAAWSAFRTALHDGYTGGVDGAGRAGRS